jgi:uncharacterized membrane-anchored protein
MHDFAKATLSKVPEVTLTFWIIKVIATTLGETGGDTLSMSVKPGYAVSSIIFIGIPRSRHNPKILWIDDAEIVGDRIT